MNGHFPRMPELVYLLKDDNVQNLVHRINTVGMNIVAVEKVCKKQLSYGYQCILGI